MLGLRTCLLSLSSLCALGGCSNGSAADHEATGATQAALAASTTQLVSWGTNATSVGLRAAAPERAAFGVPAVALGPSGDVFVLDAVNKRIVRATGGEVLPVAGEVPLDADDLALSADGAIAVRRTMSTKVLVLDPQGARIGEVDTQGMGDVDTIALGPSRRVIVKSAFQETFSLGSPHAPQLPEAAFRTRRVGADLLANGDGVVTVVKDGNAELRVIAQAKRDQGDEGHATDRAVFSLGAAASAHIVGVTASTVCMRIEHADLTQSGPLVVEREARCVDASSGKTLFRTDLGAPGLYVPRRELTFAKGKLAFAKPEKNGLRITTWMVGAEGGAK